MLPTDIARVCHEVNRAYCAALGDHSHPTWEEAPNWQRHSLHAGVSHSIAHPNSTPEDIHKSWLREKTIQGWCYGPIKSVEAKTHLCFLPYDELPLEQRIKDHLFQATVRSLAGYL